MSLQTILQYLKNNSKVICVVNGTLYEAELIKIDEKEDDSCISVRIPHLLQTELSFYWNDEKQKFWLSTNTYLLFPDIQPERIESTIYVISDLHTEFGPTVGNNPNNWPNADILILAGDIGNPNLISFRDLLITAKEKYSEVIFVAGNHEFYGCNYNQKTVIDKMKTIAIETKTHFLHRESKIIRGIEFIGTTLWTLIGDLDCNYLRDFNEGVFKERIDYVEEFITDYSFIRDTLNNSSSTHPKIVITHHLPIKKLIHSKFHSNPYNSAFYTDILHKINLKNIIYWFCGHTHEYMKTKYGNTTLVVNPVGYPNENKITKISNEVFTV